MFLTEGRLLEVQDEQGYLQGSLGTMGLYLEWLSASILALVHITRVEIQFAQQRVSCSLRRCCHEIHHKFLHFLGRIGTHRCVLDDLAVIAPRIMLGQLMYVS